MMHSMYSMQRSRSIRVLSTPCIRGLSQFKMVGVVGLGLMGHGVAQVAAAAGYQVLAIEAKPEALEVGMKRIQTSLSKLMSKNIKTGQDTEESGKRKYDEILGRISQTTTLADARDCDLIIEAIVEKEDVKIDFYKALGPLINSECIFASNTSSLAISNMAIASGRPDRFVGLHFFNPVQVMKLVEVISTNHTDPAVTQLITEFGKRIGKVTVNCGDTPGFIVNRLLVPFLAQAMIMVDRKDATIGDIDVAMQLGTGHPMGPLQLADYVGLDTAHSILSGWKQLYPDEPSFVLPKCLIDKVSRGDLGRKTGRGFYTWDGDRAVSPTETD